MGLSTLRDMLQARDLDALFGACSSLAYLEDRCRQSLDALLEDLDFVLRKAPTPLAADERRCLACGSALDRGVLERLETVLYQHRTEIAADPAALFARVYNELFWFDGPHRAEQELEPVPQDTALWRWMASWREAREASRSGPWLRSLRPPGIPIAALPAWGVDGEPTALAPDGEAFLLRKQHPCYVGGRPWTLIPPGPSGQERLVVYQGDTAQLFSVDGVTPLATLVHQAPLQQALFVGEGRLLLTATASQAHAWNGHDGAPVASAAPGPIAQLVPLDDGPVLLHHPDGARLWTLQDTFATSLQGAPTAHITRTVGQEAISYRLATRRSPVPRTLTLLETRSGRPRLAVASNTFVFGRISPDGRTLLICTQKGAQLWSMDTLTPRFALGPVTDLNGACFSRDGATVCLATATEAVAFRTADGARFASHAMPCDGKLLLAGEGHVLVYDGRAWRLWDLRTGDLLGQPMEASAHYSTASPLGDALVACDGRLVGWALPSCEQRFERRHDAADVSFLGEGETFALHAYSADDTPARRIGEAYCTRTGEPRPDADTRIFEPHGRFSLSYAGYDDDTSRMILSNVRTRRPVAQIRHAGWGHAERRAFFSRDGRTLLLGDGQRARVVALPEAFPGGWRDDAPLVQGGGNPVFSSTCATLLLDEQEGVSLWDVARGRRLLRFQDEARVSVFGRPARVLLRAGDGLVARSLEDGRALWRLPHAPPRYRGSERCHALPDERLLILDNGLGDVLAVEEETGTTRYGLSASHVSFVGHGLLVTSDAAGAAVRETSSGQVRATLPPGGARYQISRDRTWLVRAVEYKGIEIWDLAMVALRCMIPTHESSYTLLENPLRIETCSTMSPQSGNQDLNMETVYDALTGEQLGYTEWWSGDSATSRSEKLAPGISTEDDTLSVHGARVSLPRRAVVGLADGGALYVASIVNERLELYAVEGLP